MLESPLTFVLKLIYTLPLRNDGIVIAITFWQWFVEFIFNVMVIGMIAVSGVGNRQIDQFVTIFGFFVGRVVIPSFYLMACAEFRRDMKTFGLRKAFWMALTHSTDYVDYE